MANTVFPNQLGDVRRMADQAEAQAATSGTLSSTLGTQGTNRTHPTNSQTLPNRLVQTQPVAGHGLYSGLHPELSGRNLTMHGGTSNPPTQNNMSNLTYGQMGSPQGLTQQEMMDLIRDQQARIQALESHPPTPSPQMLSRPSPQGAQTQQDQTQNAQVQYAPLPNQQELNNSMNMLWKHVKPPHFGGNKYEFLPFWDDFEVMVDQNKGLPKPAKLMLLKTWLSKEVQESCWGTSANRMSYDQAVEGLFKRYCDKTLMRDA